jgi:Tfp pilus assembly protein PilF
MAASWGETVNLSMLRLPSRLGVAALAFVLAVALSACASAPPPAPLPAAPSLFRDAAFAAPSQPVSAEQVFEFSPAMQNFLRTTGHQALREGDPRRALVEMLYKKQKLGIEYDSSTTRTAAETYAARAGNCLSLVIMTSAFAKALGVPVTYQRVLVDEAWSRSGTLYFASGHVNLMLGWAPSLSRFTRELQPPLVVDFLPAEELRGQRTQPIGEQTIVAMFMNNRAAEAMAAGRIDDAYWWAREALLQDPAFLIAYNTLGVVYLRRDMAADAERLFGEILAREPDNVKVMGNQVQALRAQGRLGEAEALAERLAKMEPVPPFHWFNAGLEAMRARDFGKARELFQRELRRESAYHEFHFWLAQAELGLGNVRAARRELELALQNSPTQSDHNIYAAKLDRLRALRAQ